MNTRSRVCRSCGGLNGAGEQRCYRCGVALGGLGPALGAWFSRPAVATQTLVALCCVNFAFLVYINGSMPLSLIGAGPRLSAMAQTGAIMLDFASREPWRLLAAVYGHLGVLHLGMNMLALVQLGRAVEQQLGSARLVVLFTVTGVLGFVASGLWYGHLSPPTAGASGALFGLLGHQIGVLHAQNNPNTKSLLLQQLAYALAMALLLPVNNAAHFGGFAAGFGMGWLFFFEKRPARLESLARAAALVCLGLAVASIVLSARSPLVAEARVYDALRD